MKNKNFESYTKSLNLKQVHTGRIWTEGPCYLKHFNKTINFAYNTNDQALLKDLSRGLSNTSGSDSDIDYISIDN